jgi:hypothetical protein
MSQASPEEPKRIQEIKEIIKKKIEKNTGPPA